MRQLYREPGVEPRQVATRIVTALDQPTRVQMSGPGVVSCLHTLLRGARQVALGGLASFSGGGPAALGLAQSLRQQAERDIVAGGHASRFADLGLNALGTATLDAAAAGAPGFLHLNPAEVTANFGAYARQQRLGDLARCFLAHDFDHLFRYFVSRDLSDFIGGPGLPSVAEASRLRDAVTLHCRQVAQGVSSGAYETALAAAALEETPSALLGELLRDLIAAGLHQIVAEGGE